MLISRTESKLKEVAAELSGKFGVEARYVAADLCKAGPDTFAKIGAALEGLEVGGRAGRRAGQARAAGRPQRQPQPPPPPRPPNPYVPGRLPQLPAAHSPPHTPRWACW